MKIDEGLNFDRLRANLDTVLHNAGITLSPIPFEREFESFETSADVIVYRCIRGSFDPQQRNDSWSLNPQHALEYASPDQKSPGVLLLAQLPISELRHNIHYFSRRGDKIILKEDPSTANIAVFPFASFPYFSCEALRCMRHVIRLGIDPDNETDRRFSDQFSSEELQFKAVLHEWATGIRWASRTDGIKVPENVSQDYYERIRQ